MTTAVKEPSVKPSKEIAKTESAALVLQPAAKVLFLGDVAAELIDVATNVRKKFDERPLKELAANVAQLGRVISPITLRPSEKAGRYELVAGERRLRAAKMAGLPKISAQVLALNDVAALEYQAAENLHRKDLSPIEEARAFQTMLKSRNEKGKTRFTVEDLHNIIGKPVVYIYRSVSLLELPAEIIDAIEEGTLTPSHGLQILRLPKDKRAKFCAIALRGQTGNVSDDVQGSAAVALGAITAKELQVQIDSEVGRSLAKGQFPKDVPYAGEVACALCPLNSANQGMLFDGATEGRCLSKPCFDKKTEQVYVDLQGEGKKRWPQLEFVGRGMQDSNYKRTIDGKPGIAMLSAEETGHAVIKKLLAQKPHKLGYAVVLPRSGYMGYQMKKWEKARLVMAVLEPALIGGMRTEKIVDCTKPEKPSKHRKETSRSETPGEKAKSEREQFIEDSVEVELGKAADTAFEKAGVKELVSFFLPTFKYGYCLDAVKKSGVDIKKLDAAGCLRILAILEIDNDGITHDQIIKRLGGDEKALTAKLMKEASAEFDAKVEAEKQALLKKYNAPAAKR